MQPIKRPSIRKSKSQHPIEIQPDYTEDESEEQNNNSNNPVAFSSYYPSGSMTLPHPKHKKSSQSQTSATSELKKDQAEQQPPNPASSAASSEPKKSLNESGESDPGYESDSSKSKSNSSGGGQPQPAQATLGLEASTALLMTEPKATTLPRRSATVQKNSALQHTLDRRKLRAEPALTTGTRTESEAGLTVEIISPVRVSLNTISFFYLLTPRDAMHPLLNQAQAKKTC